eukprot:TRINITY_DN37455_c0_g1_i1.p1 TRINITY_DN37455_c0_g1~~TRINITY_DN37455_c0_g1_i1.p1  ORF type:complete len:470 (+),score=16.91 TRINITY_DN37455_c0_g1_i1:122-1531(+)
MAPLILKTSEIRNTHGSIAPVFSCGTHTDETIQKLKEDPSFLLPPLVIVKFEGRYWSVSNRRLYCYKQAGIPELVEHKHFNVMQPHEHFFRGLTTKTEGKTVTLFPESFCPKCKLTFKSRTALQQHNDVHHRVTKIGDLFQCRLCKKDFRTEGALFQHKTLCVRKYLDAKIGGLLQHQKSARRNNSCGNDQWHSESFRIPDRLNCDIGCLIGPYGTTIAVLKAMSGVSSITISDQSKVKVCASDPKCVTNCVSRILDLYGLTNRDLNEEPEDAQSSDPILRLRLKCARPKSNKPVLLLLKRSVAPTTLKEFQELLRQKTGAKEHAQVTLTYWYGGTSQVKASRRGTVPSAPSSNTSRGMTTEEAANESDKEFRAWLDTLFKECGDPGEGQEIIFEKIDGRLLTKPTWLERKLVEEEEKEEDPSCHTLWVPSNVQHDGKMKTNSRGGFGKNKATQKRELKRGNINMSDDF